VVHDKYPPFGARDGSSLDHRPGAPDQVDLCAMPSGSG